MTATTERQGLLADVLAHPADDTPRLVYADWCEENGDPARGEFIRVQIELQDMPEGHGKGQRGCRWCDLQAEAEGLLIDLCEALLPPCFVGAKLGVDRDDCALVTYAPRREVELHFRRGFVAAVVCPLAAWREHGPALVRQQPLERVRFSDRKPMTMRSRVDKEDALRWFAGETESYELPWWLWEHPKDFCEMPMDQRHLVKQPPICWVFPTEQAAWDAISNHSLAWARDQE